MPGYIEKLLRKVDQMESKARQPLLFITRLTINRPQLKQQRSTPRRMLRLHKNTNYTRSCNCRRMRHTCVGQKPDQSSVDFTSWATSTGSTAPYIVPAKKYPASSRQSQKLSSGRHSKMPRKLSNSETPFTNLATRNKRQR